MQKIKSVCVFGSYKNLGKTQMLEVIKLGHLLAQNGFDVVTGGFGGTMESVSKGAKAAGGKTVGVTFYKWETPLYNSPNQFIDEEIIADLLWKRIEIMLDRADAFIILPGGTGTLLELAACLEFMNKGLMPIKPIIAIGSYWKPVIKRLNKELVFSNQAKARGNKYCHHLVLFANSVNDAVKKLLKI